MVLTTFRKLFRGGLILLLLAFSTAIGLMAQDTGTTLLHDDYSNIEFDVQVTENCCLLITPRNLVMHDYRIYIDNAIELDPEYHHEENHAIEWCPPESAKGLTDYVLQLDIYCNECNHRETRYDTLDLSNCEEAREYLEIGENCCVYIFLNPSEYYTNFTDFNSLFTLAYRDSENWPFEENHIPVSMLATDFSKMKKVIEICPPADNRSIVYIDWVLINNETNERFPIKEEITSSCCDCKNKTELPPITLVKIPDEDVTGCSGCAYRLEYTSDRDGLPEWTDCYDEITIVSKELFDSQGTNILNTLNSSIENFQIGDFGYICLGDSTGKGRLTVKFRKLPDSLAYDGDICSYLLNFDCNGVTIPDSTFIPSNETIMPCTPDCPDSTWIYERGAVYYDNPSCGFQDSVYYEFAYRKCGDYQDVELLSYIHEPGSNMSNCDFEAMDKEMVKEIITDIIDENVMNFQPMETSRQWDPGREVCDNTWRFSTGSCWTSQQYVGWSYSGGELEDSYISSDAIFLFEGNNLESDPLLDPFEPIISEKLYHKVFYGKYKCSDVDCCKFQLEVCKVRPNWYTDPHLVPGYPKLIHSDQQFSCDHSWKTILDFEEGQYKMKQCEPVCEEIMTMFEPAGSPKLIAEYNNEEAINDYQFESYFANDNINVKFYSDDNSNVDMIVYDAAGNTLDSKDLIFGKGKQHITIDTRNYISGTYYYVVIIDNKVIKSDNFVIVR